MPESDHPTILITGATDGVGRALARRLAGRGASLLLHGRNEQKGQELIEQIHSDAGRQRIEYLNADFASLADVHALAPHPG